VRRQLGLYEKIGGVEREPLAVMIMALYRQAEIYRRPPYEDGFYMPLQ